MVDKYLILMVMIGVVVFTFIYLALMAKDQGKTAAINKAREIAYQLMVRAEKQMKTETGRAKMSYVMNLFWARVPAAFKLIITRDDADKFVQNLYEELVDYMDDGVMNNSDKMINEESPKADPP